MATPETGVHSILLNIKKMIGFDKEYTYFDRDLIININSCFATLHDLGVGPDQGFQITDKDDIWQDYSVSEPYLSMVKQYVYIKTKLVFDRPETSYAIQAMQSHASELEWRLHSESEYTRDAEE